MLCFGLDRCEQVLRLKRKGRTGFKPSGLRDELPGLPVPSVKYSTNEVAFMFRTACHRPSFQPS